MRIWSGIGLVLAASLPFAPGLGGCAQKGEERPQSAAATGSPDVWMMPARAMPAQREAGPPNSESAIRQPSLKAAIQYARPYMGDERAFTGPHIGHPRVGWRLLFAWATRHMSWSLVARGEAIEPEDMWVFPDRYRGTVVCVRGILVKKVGPSELLLRVSEAGLEASILLAGGRETLVPGGSNRACGVLVGTYDVWGRGLDARGLALVGMLDAPDFQTWVPPAPLPAEVDSDSSEISSDGVTL